MQQQSQNARKFGVSNLTLKVGRWRISDASQRRGMWYFKSAAAQPFILLIKLAAGTCIYTHAAYAETSQATQWQARTEIAAAAEEFAKQRYGSSESGVTPVAGHLDSRLRLPRCQSALEAFVRPGTKLSSRVVVGVRCNGKRPWKVYVPVDVVVMQPILVAKKTFPRGHVLGPNDVVFANHDVSRLSSGYLSSLDELTGKRLKQQLSGGRIVNPSMLVAEMLIRRGQSVTLLVRNAQMNISMAGTALSDGALNQRIRVENINSQRIVEGLVRSPETVEILVHQ